MMVSTILVMLMTVPGLALFYGGLVRSKNMLSVLMQVMVTFSLIVVLWFIYGYSWHLLRAAPSSVALIASSWPVCGTTLRARLPMRPRSARVFTFLRSCLLPSRPRLPVSPAR